MELLPPPWASVLREAIPPLVLHAALASVLVLAAAAVVTSFMRAPGPGILPAPA